MEQVVTSMLSIGQFKSEVNYEGTPIYIVIISQYTGESIFFVYICYNLPTVTLQTQTFIRPELRKGTNDMTHQWQSGTNRYMNIIHKPESSHQIFFFTYSKCNKNNLQKCFRKLF